LGNQIVLLTVYLDPDSKIILNTLEISGKSVAINGLATPCSGATITRINWTWGDGNSGDQWFKASHTYSTSGTYLVDVHVTDSTGAFVDKYYYVAIQ